MVTHRTKTVVFWLLTVVALALIGLALQHGERLLWAAAGVQTVALGVNLLPERVWVYEDGERPGH